VKLAVVTGSGRKEHAARINEAWQRGVSAVIETGLRIEDAKADLSYGEYEKMVRTHLHFSPQTALKLRAIASNKVLSNPAHVRHLPPSWGTLSELAVIANQGCDLEAAIESGAIHPRMARKDVKALLPPPQRDDDLEEDMPTREEAEESYQQTLRDAGEPYDHQSPWKAHGQPAPDDGDSPEVIWRRGLLHRAEEAAGHALYEDWSQFTADSEVVAAAERAAEAWEKTAAYLRELRHARLRSDTTEEAIDPVEPTTPVTTEPKRRGRPPGSKNKQKTIVIDETIEVVAPTVADDFSDTLAARMRQGESAGAPDDPFEIPPMFDRTGGTP
jgi:hypothetical protein